MIDDILRLLQKCPPARYEQGEDFVRVLPCSEEGFEVVIEQIWEGHFAVSFGGWREDYYNLKEALECFSFGLSNRCRLKVQSKDGTPFRWTVEYRDESEWREGTTKSKWNYKILTPVVIVYLQNNLLAANEFYPCGAKPDTALSQNEGSLSH
jgi:hypothetical protein